MTLQEPAKPDVPLKDPTAAIELLQRSIELRQQSIETMRDLIFQLRVAWAVQQQGYRADQIQSVGFRPLTNLQLVKLPSDMRRRLSRFSNSCGAAAAETVETIAGVRRRLVANFVQLRDGTHLELPEPILR